MRSSDVEVHHGVVVGPGPIVAHGVGVDAGRAVVAGTDLVPFSELTRWHGLSGNERPKIGSGAVA